MGTITITLTDKEAESFRLWREYQDKFELLVDNRVFDLRNGSAEIHFNPQGEIGSIDLHAKVYRRVEIAVVTVDSVKKMVQ